MTRAVLLRGAPPRRRSPVISPHSLISLVMGRLSAAVLGVSRFRARVQLSCSVLRRAHPQAREHVPYVSVRARARLRPLPRSSHPSIGLDGEGEPNCLLCRLPFAGDHLIRRALLSSTPSGILFLSLRAVSLSSILSSTTIRQAVRTALLPLLASSASEKSIRLDFQ